MTRKRSHPRKSRVPSSASVDKKEEMVAKRHEEKEKREEEQAAVAISNGVIHQGGKEEQKSHACEEAPCAVGEVSAYFPDQHCDGEVDNDSHLDEHHGHEELATPHNTDGQINVLTQDSLELTVNGSEKSRRKKEKASEGETNGSVEHSSKEDINGGSKQQDELSQVLGECGGGEDIECFALKQCLSLMSSCTDKAESSAQLSHPYDVGEFSAHLTGHHNDGASNTDTQLTDHNTDGQIGVPHEEIRPCPIPPTHGSTLSQDSLEPAMNVGKKKRRRHKLVNGSVKARKKRERNGFKDGSKDETSGGCKQQGETGQAPWFPHLQKQIVNLDFVWNSADEDDVDEAPRVPRAPWTPHLQRQLIDLDFVSIHPAEHPIDKSPEVQQLQSKPETVDLNMEAEGMEPKTVPTCDPHSAEAHEELGENMKNKEVVEKEEPLPPCPLAKSTTKTMDGKRSVNKTVTSGEVTIKQLRTGNRPEMGAEARRECDIDLSPGRCAVEQHSAYLVDQHCDGELDNDSHLNEHDDGEPIPHEEIRPCPIQPPPQDSTLLQHSLEPVMNARKKRRRHKLVNGSVKARKKRERNGLTEDGRKETNGGSKRQEETSQVLEACGGRENIQSLSPEQCLSPERTGVHFLHECYSVKTIHELCFHYQSPDPEKVEVEEKSRAPWIPWDPWTPHLQSQIMNLDSVWTHSAENPIDKSLEAQQLQSKPETVELNMAAEGMEAKIVATSEPHSAESQAMREWLMEVQHTRMLCEQAARELKPVHEMEKWELLREMNKWATILNNVKIN